MTILTLHKFQIIRSLCNKFRYLSNFFKFIYFKVTITFIFLFSISGISLADFPIPLPTAVNPQFSLLVEIHTPGYEWCTGYIPGMSCWVTDSSIEGLIQKAITVGTAYAARYNIPNSWTGCVVDTIVDYSLEHTGGGTDGYDNGVWGYMSGSNCGGTIYYNNTWKCPAGFHYDWHPYRQCYPDYVVMLTPDQQPPQVCVGNPLDVSSGAKYQKETDIPGRGAGQIFLERYYGNPNNKSAPAWHHNYEKRIVAIDPTSSNMVVRKSSHMPTMSSACLAGWYDINNSFAPGSSATFSNGKCQVIRNGVVVKNLPIALDAQVDTATTAPGAVKLMLPDGNAFTFQYAAENLYYSLDGQLSLERPNANGIMWRFKTSDGEINDFSAGGQLISVTSSNGLKQTLDYDTATGLLTTVTDSVGQKLKFIYTGSQLANVITSDNKTTSYIYNTLGLITDVKRSDNTHRLYHYEDSRFPTYLTGITDESGVRFATWTYDAQGRGISSEHSGGTEKTLLAFNTDGSTTVTNPLNKQTIYRFADIAGSRRVTSVEGQATASCLAANQNYTYTPEGWVASKTDWGGNKTTYIYNTKGQETSRTEAYGTPVAKTITTEWHPTLNLKTKITEPDNETIFNYNTNGFLLNQNTRSLP